MMSIHKTPILAAPADALAAANLINLAIGPGSTCTESLRTMMAEGAALFLVRADEQDALAKRLGRSLAAALLLQPVTSPRFSASMSLGMIVFLAVHPAHRGNGHSARLVATAAAWAIERGLTHFAACAWLSGARVQSADMLKRAGFMPAGELPMPELMPGRVCPTCSGACICTARVMLRSIDASALLDYRGRRGV